MLIGFCIGLKQLSLTLANLDYIFITELRESKIFASSFVVGSIWFGTPAPGVNDRRKAEAGRKGKKGIV